MNTDMSKEPEVCPFCGHEFLLWTGGETYRCASAPCGRSFRVLYSHTKRDQLQRRLGPPIVTGIEEVRA